MRIAVVANTAWYLCNFRLNLMLALKNSGHSVVGIAPSDENSKNLISHGLEFEDVAISGSGINPIKEFFTVLNIRKALRKHKIDLVLSYTPKGNLYSALACIASSIPFIPNVSGLGRTFIHPSPITHIVTILYKLTFNHAHHVFFQNNDDMKLFVERKLLDPRRCERLPGSGVDLSYFMPSPLPDRDSKSPVFLLIARMLWDKGVGEYVDAARQLQSQFPNARWRMLGFIDVANPSAIPGEQIKQWCENTCIEYLGPTKDVRPFIMDADCVVLPSYREGVPRTLLEAAASGRPLITTDVPGCRDALIPGRTGLLCQAANAHDLAEKMKDFINLEANHRQQMGNEARIFIESNFDEAFVIESYKKIIDTFPPRSINS